MDITLIKDSTFKLKGKTGFALTNPTGLTLQSLDGSNVMEFKTAGEYEVAGISVIGIKVDENVVFVYEIDGLRICNLGNNLKKLSDGKVSAIGDIDVLLLPVGAESVELLQQIESYYIIPYGYANQDELDKFLKDSGYSVERLSKFSLKKDDIVEDQTTEVKVLSN